jgi:hypothetical protein
MSSVPIEEAAMSGHRSLRSVPVPILSLFFGLFGAFSVCPRSRTVYPVVLSGCWHKRTVPIAVLFLSVFAPIETAAVIHC